MESIRLELTIEELAKIKIALIERISRTGNEIETYEKFYRKHSEDKKTLGRILNMLKTQKTEDEAVIKKLDEAILNVK
ncbi:hypothetical protein [Thermoflavimicrobium dichotomicum]|uniref:Uncharacterized protein n=1 Tax=Thermoflavimicrobium dichotomicum TaxID=46223 RepID=A0A1I3S368_9BACL|nr:hypothetical protein [Thermoflavimicrobium dichotomicum]SFJ52027.1 hypothetical protein SAMN05421852_111108 [Thermoflavimicrobium dichotomicum]